MKTALMVAKPDWVIACYGINDALYHPVNDKRFAAEVFLKQWPAIQASAKGK